MTLQDTAYFELTNYCDLYSKAQHDLARLDELVNSYDLFNFLCTINHLHDWAEKEPSLSMVAIPDNTTGVLNVVRQLCNRAKHFTKRQSHPDTMVKKGYGMGRYGVGTYGVGEPSYTVSVDGKEISVLQICKDALSVWDAFMQNQSSASLVSNPCGEKYVG